MKRNLKTVRYHQGNLSRKEVNNTSRRTHQTSRSNQSLNNSVNLNLLEVKLPQKKRKRKRPQENPNRMGRRRKQIGKN
jgi:hypothetical protein